MGSEFDASCLRTTAVNRKCNRNPDGLFLLAGPCFPYEGKLSAARLTDEVDNVT